MRCRLYLDNQGTDHQLLGRDFLPGYRVLDPVELPPNSNARVGVEHSGFVLHPAKYILWLKERLVARGVTFQRAEIQSIAELQSEAFGLPDLVINASGVGSATLSGVEDLDVLPIR
jgi:D-amino-acid oxidase